MLEIRILFVALIYVSSTLSAPSITTDLNSLVVSTETPTGSPKETAKESENVPTVPKIYDMKVVSNVANRFATTHITSKVKNLGQSAQQATFFVILPETAYISGFVMEIGGKNYTAYVKEKEEAKQIYDEAVQSGVAAAHVEAKARDSNKFTVSVNVEPQSKATFYLTYEELIKRQHGQYEVVINIHPGQLVKNLGIEVNVNETRPLKFVKQVPFLRSGNEISKNDDKIDAKANVQVFNETSAKVTFNPDLEDQMAFVDKLGGKEGDGLAGQFVVQYDVERDPLKGEVLVSDGYFVHFFAPSDIPSLNKHVVFVLDTSGSMYGTKIEQLKTAMKSILGELKKDDTFNIVEFNSYNLIWNVTEKKEKMENSFPRYYGMDDGNIPKVEEVLVTGAFDVTDQNIKNAKEIIDGLQANGGTNIQPALEAALDLIKKAKGANKNSNQPIVIFLTDGQGGVGDEFISSFTKSNNGTTPIFSLSFGEGADRDFLQKLSLKNQGFERHIYEAADASLQLEAFYQQISSPLLSDVHFKYVSKNVTKVTKSTFPIWFGGSELVVAGNYHGYDFPTPLITGYGRRGPIELQSDVKNPIGSLERLWAYLTVQQLLEERNGAANKENYTKQALEIALKYSFVTPISSLVVVKPNNTKSEENTEDASKAESRFPGYQGFPAPQYTPGALSPARLHSFPTLGYRGGFASQSFGIPAGGFPSPIRLGAPSPFHRQNLPSSPLSTTFNKQTFPIILPYTTPANPLTVLKVKFPWLANILNANETVSLPAGNYKLGLGAQVPDHPECTPGSFQLKGTCQLLEDCPQMHPLLDSIDVFVTYFCPLNEFAGVCCPTAPNIGLPTGVPVQP